jgi:hypothetical protein
MKKQNKKNKQTTPAALATPAGSDPPPTPPPAPPPPRPRGDVRREFLDELSLARKVGAAAADPGYLADLSRVEMDPTLAGKIQVQIAQIDPLLTELKAERTDRATMTQQEKAARSHLLEVLQPIQTAAKRKYVGDVAKQREAYYINAGLGSKSLDTVVTACNTVLGRLTPATPGGSPLDTLPGITADGDILALRQALGDYTSRDAAQEEEGEDAEATLDKIEAAIKALAPWRRAVQQAADQAWPWRKPGSAAYRRAFALPTDRPLA